MLSSLSLTFSLFFSFPLLSPLSHRPRCNPDQPRCKGELPASFSRRVALPPSSDFPLAYPPARTLPARVFARRLFPSFPFSQSTSNFLDVAQAKRQHRIAQRPAPLAPGFDAEERSLHFYETLRTLRRPVGTDRPSSSPSRSPPFPVLPGFTCYEQRGRVLFGASPWNSCATIYSKSIFRLFRGSARHSRRTYMGERLHMCTKI